MSKEIIDPFTPDQTLVRGILTERPSEPEYILKHDGRGLMTKGIVGQLSAGGGTGKTRLLTQLSVASAAKKQFAYFSVDWPLKILLLNAEDTQDQLDTMLWDACDGDFPDGLYARSVKGIVGPLMALEGNEPVRTKWWNWLDETITAHENLDLVIIDPKSRFYGLDENSNDHNTQWVACLEALTVKHGISIIFAHHVPKHTKEINQWMGRGGGALTDACRCNMGMVGLTEKEAKKWKIDDWRNYVKLAISKTNVGPKSKGNVYLKFDESGMLHPVNLRNERIQALKGIFLDILAQDPDRYSRRELRRDKRAKHIITQHFVSFTEIFQRLFGLGFVKHTKSPYLKEKKKISMSKDRFILLIRGLNLF